MVGTVGKMEKMWFVVTSYIVTVGTLNILQVVRIGKIE